MATVTGPPLLFESPRFYVRELLVSELPELQLFFEANPEYFLAVNDRRPNADEAQVEFDEVPPQHLGFSKRWFTGIFNRTGAHTLEGANIVVSDLSAPRVWHIALFLLATRLYGTGAAAEVYSALEEWSGRSGAEWLRLGVVQGNARAERFWQARGFSEVRFRHSVNASGRKATIRVLAKPLAAGTLSEYLRLVPRDQPNSLLP